MPKKKIDAEIKEIEQELISEDKEPSPAIKQRVRAIVEQSSNVGDIEGEPFDINNAEHLIIAAWLVGRNGLLRK